MLVDAVCAILDRDLQALAREVQAYPDDASLWQLPEGCRSTPPVPWCCISPATSSTTSARGSGVPATCAIGPRSSPPATYLARRCCGRSKRRSAAVRIAADKLSDETLQTDFPEVIAGMRVVTGEYLIHLVSHFDYHLGQVDYHRRLVTRDSRGVDAVRTAELASARPVAD